MAGTLTLVSQPTDSNPAGRMMRRTLANMASFYTEQMSVDVREGIARRVGGATVEDLQVTDPRRGGCRVSLRRDR